MDQIYVPTYDFTKGRLRSAFAVIPQELLVRQTVHSLDSTLRRPNRTGKGEKVTEENSDVRQGEREPR